MVKIQTIGLCASLMFSLNACTSVVWNGGIYDADRAIDSETEIVATQSESLHAFTLLPEQHDPMLSGSLLMSGRHYRYAVHPAVSRDLAAVLAADLPQAYRIRAPYSGAALSALPLRLHDDNRFDSQFCLDYRAHSGEERRQLQQLGFYEQYRSGRYRKCFALNGTLYLADSGHSTTLRREVPVTLTLERRILNVRNDKLARNILLTPLAFAVDTVSGAVMLPVLLVGEWL